MTLETTTITDDSNTERVVVVDPAGGIWHPGEDAATRIAAAADPRAEAVRLCEEEPMSGEWRQ